MLKRGYGRIINISSLFGKVATPQLPISTYNTVKGGVINLTRGAAAEWAKNGITVNCICPGWFESESNSPESMEALGPWINERTPMGRAGVPGELDTTVIYLAADESTYVTGAIISCDGGWTCCLIPRSAGVTCSMMGFHFVLQCDSQNNNSIWYVERRLLMATGMLK